jgi:ABC-type sugar transport system ATPase subunit
VVVQVRDLALRTDSAPFSLEVAAGELVGLAGLEGHGQDELLKVLAGLTPPQRGEVLVGGGETPPQPVGTYRQSVRRGVVYVPRDRKVEGLADVLSVLDNYALPTLRRDAVAGLLDLRRTQRRFRRDAATVNFAPGAQASVGRLSGGNQQKVILARWLAADPKVILLNDPTRGVDLKTKHELYDLLRTLAGNGLTVVMISTEVEELVHLMDRVFVFHGGSLAAELGHDQITRDALVAAYFGHVPTPTPEAHHEPA